MAELKDNILNRRLGPEEPKFKLWTNAGLMLTYWCPARCDCCYVCAGPRPAALNHEMTAEFAIECWQGIRKLAGDAGQIHLTGGEPFGDYPRLKKILQLACAKNLAGLQKIETNAYWCTDPQIVRSRLIELKSLGLTKLQVSTDIYHQRYVPFERVRLAITIATEILGEQAVRIRWRDFYENPILTDDFEDYKRHEAIANELKKRPERLLGRAVEKLITHFPSRNYDEFAENNCIRAIFGARHVHIDGEANIFPGTCVGIKLGNLRAGGGRGLDEVWRMWDYHEHPILAPLVEHGPVGLVDVARSMGYRPMAGYASKCHLCYDVRKFLHYSGQYTQWLGPETCYDVDDGDGKAGEKA
jgi:hypothetical protein